jgi:Flp pilus assembly protein TadG
VCASRRKFGARLARDDSGASAVEFALLSPLLVLILVGMIQVGWALHCAASVRWALDASARSLLVDPDQTADELRSAMLARLSGLADTRTLAVTLQRNATDRTLVVSTHYEADLTLPLIPTDTLTFRNVVTVPTLD